MEERIPVGRLCNRCAITTGSNLNLVGCCGAAVSSTSTSSTSGRASRAGPSASRADVLEDLAVQLAMKVAELVEWIATEEVLAAVLTSSSSTK
jgi:hypothetical protein